MMPSRAIDQYCGAAGRMWPSWATPPNRIRLPLLQRPMLKSDPQARRDDASAPARADLPRRRGDPGLVGAARASRGRQFRPEKSPVPALLPSITLVLSLLFSCTFCILKIYTVCLDTNPRIQHVIADGVLVPKLSCRPNMVCRRAARRRREIADRTTIVNQDAKSEIVSKWYSICS